MVYIIRIYYFDLFSKHVQLILMIQAPDRRWSSLCFLHSSNTKKSRGTWVEPLRERLRRRDSSFSGKSCSCPNVYDLYSSFFINDPFQGLHMGSYSFVCWLGVVLPILHSYKIYTWVYRLDGTRQRTYMILLMTTSLWAVTKTSTLVICCIYGIIPPRSLMIHIKNKSA